ncbi:hypothetical protein Pfo_000574 [Paulownia fortunei]|nr:hypothetical protein Pfo_000574 [Paulownia fortunei]
MPQNRTIHAFVLIFAFISIATALNNIPRLPDGLDGLGLLSGLGGPTPPDVGLGLSQIPACLKTTTSVPGCIKELISSVLSFQFQFLTPSCCTALLQVEENCWPKIFPLNPLVPPLLIKIICTSVQAQPLSPPPPPP